MADRLIEGDTLETLKTWRESDTLERLGPLSMVFMDPPDNIGLSYADDLAGDTWETTHEYICWLGALVDAALRLSPKVWLSVNARWLPYIMFDTSLTVRPFIWTYTFGNYNPREITSAFRPIYRISSGSNTLWHPEAVRVRSTRAKMGDKRRAGEDKNPDDVLTFPRIVGNSPERRSWHPTQHPEALYEWILRYSLGEHPLGTVLDCFAGSGTCFRSWGNYGVDVIGIERSPTYCEALRDEHGL